ncbi:transglutaminase/protease-like domain protein [Geotalea daltonii FRC-32]|uniref:Transglutaminase/protease-like domain protein n=1 Tax=Geotalea daltonii (strain DSM 22248 / JCM 15807 / FRC-32) TaxID=316067 RepID=B9M1A3_GEODF|nr:transglutaminase-like domain-containing protein [Geotalea daltonii]ACM19173.1 transglutaminase/protease-like domain protein [Geotalea daltonii FRC-32]
MFRKYARQISAVVLCFFTWTSGGVFSIANAAQIEAKKAKAQQVEKKPEGAEERFAKETEEVEEILGDKKEDLQTKKWRLRKKKAEIEALDVEVRKQFAETEKKLKDAKLPPEILERHRKFVKHYDDNLAELKGNLDIIEKAKDKAEAEAGMEKARRHLEKTKAPSRHQKLDPNNLPHRQPKVIKREPRMKKEEFEKDLKKDKHAWKNQMRIMLASAGSTAGLLTPDDLAETIEVQLTPEIRAKALELGNNPVKIYEWVRNNIEFVPTWGSIQGAQMTMQTKQGNAFDTSSLLIALLRTAGIHARYVTGTVELPIEKIMNWAGGFSDPMAALDFMSSGGIPTTALTAAGKVEKARFEHVWVEAWIDYRPSRGAKHINGKGDTWIPLDPSFKQYNYSQGIDIKTAVPFDVQAFLTQIQSTATVNEAAGYVTGVDSVLTQQTMQDYQTRVQNYIQQNYPNATVGDVLGKKEIIKKEYSYLLGTLPYKTAVKGGSFSVMPDSFRHKLSFNVTTSGLDETPIALTMSLPELAGKRISLNYLPAAEEDAEVIAHYGYYSAPPYLVNLKPVILINGIPVWSAKSVPMAASQFLRLTFSSPNISDDTVIHPHVASAFVTIGLNLQKITIDQLEKRKQLMQAATNQLGKEDVSLDDLVGEVLNIHALAYWMSLDTFNKNLAVRRVAYSHLPAEMAVMINPIVKYVYGIPCSMRSPGLQLDVKRNINVRKSLDGVTSSEIGFTLSSGFLSSTLEHGVFDILDPEGRAISTVKALSLANEAGIPIYSINSSNISSILPKLKTSPDTLDNIRDSVAAGKVVIIPEKSVQYYQW